MNVAGAKQDREYLSVQTVTHLVLYTPSTVHLSTHLILLIVVNYEIVNFSSVDVTKSCHYIVKFFCCKFQLFYILDLKPLFCEVLPENLPYNRCPNPSNIVDYLHARLV